jgi:hypothetical protein
MTVKKEYEFDFLDDTWSGANDRMKSLTDDLRYKLENILSDTEEIFGEEIPDDTTVNDFLWFEDDTYADWLGFNSADQLWKYCDLIENGADEDAIYEDYDGNLVTEDVVINAFEQYKEDDPDWNDYYDNWEDWILDTQEYTKFEI